jgi:hypothetical protein
METEAVLKEFDALVEKYAQHRHYIEKARAHSTGFNPAVVEKVILDHEIHASEVADQILPLVPRIREVVADVEAREGELEKKRAEVDERMQELRLRQVIGEMDDAAFEDASASMKADIARSGGQLDALRKERDAFTSSLERWLELAGAANQDTGADRELEEIAPLEDDGSAVEVVDDEAGGQHVMRSGMVEDLSPVFAEPAVLPVPVEVPAAVEPESDENDVDLALLGEGGGTGQTGEAIDLTPEPPAAPAADNRHALLLYQEGTPEEQIYPFTGDTLTIGRGRDNDIQIKNDSKVSRYHCKLFRRGANFYIEDNKSSNGTLVGGELITEHRLLGGEEIIIGETFFRFRIMD